MAVAIDCHPWNEIKNSECEASASRERKQPWIRYRRPNRAATPWLRLCAGQIERRAGKGREGEEAGEGKGVEEAGGRAPRRSSSPCRALAGCGHGRRAGRPPPYHLESAPPRSSSRSDRGRRVARDERASGGRAAGLHRR
ncbi:unnamed protein product [Urochloa humidicola]